MAGATLTSWRRGMDRVVGEGGKGAAVAEGAQSTGPDRRRKVDRELAERIVERARLLPPAQQGLVRAVFEHERRATEVAALVGQTPRTVRRNTQRLVQRLLSPEYMFVARHMQHWKGLRRKVAAACFLEGLPARRVAENLGQSLYVVRRHRDAIQALFEAATR